MDNRILNKLWQVSKIKGNKDAGNPFERELLELNEAQLDFILEKYVTEDPKRGKFFRGGRATATMPQQYASWEKVLTGAAHERFMSRLLMSPAVRARAASLRKTITSLAKRAAKTEK